MPVEFYETIRVFDLNVLNRSLRPRARYPRVHSVWKTKNLALPLRHMTCTHCTYSFLSYMYFSWHYGRFYLFYSLGMVNEISLHDLHVVDCRCKKRGFAASVCWVFTISVTSDAVPSALERWLSSRLSSFSIFKVEKIL